MTVKRTFGIALGLITCAAAAPGLSAMQVINSVTCDGGACPRPLELVNEQPVMIGLSGQGLAGLASGVVTDKRGRPIRGVSVVLGELSRTVGTRRLTRTRGVTLTARGVPALTGLELRFTTSARGSVTAPLDLSIAAVTTAPGIVAPRDPSRPISVDRRAAVTLASATPVIRGVSPDPVLLNEAGESEVVTLHGSSLDLLYRGHIESADVKNRLTVQFLPSGDPSSRRVQILTQKSLLGAGDPGIPPNTPMRLAFDVSSDGGGGTIVAPVQVIRPMPDLVVASVAVGVPQETHVDVRYVIENRGLANATVALERPWMVDGFPPFSLVGPTAVRFVAGGPGTTLTGRLEYQNLANAGTYESAVRVPDGLTVPGSSEGAREMPFTVTVGTPARPDLVIVGVTHSPSSLVSGPEPAIFEVQVVNQGRGTASPDSRARVLEVQASDCPFLQPWRVEGSKDFELGPGASLRARLVAPTMDVDAGSYTCTFQVDYLVGGFWREADPTNNSFSYAFELADPSSSRPSGQ